MVSVRLWGSLADLADLPDGVRDINIDASNLRELLNALARDYPAFAPQLARGISVSIDGRIYNNTWSTPISPQSEVVLLSRLVGG